MSDTGPLFSWTPQKRAENWRRRKVDFAESVGIFDDPDRIEAPDRRSDYGEERIQALGSTNGTTYLVVYTWRSPVRHIITAWKVGAESQRRYRDLLARNDRGDEAGGQDPTDTG